jgi:hypothetical protein
MQPLLGEQWLLVLLLLLLCAAVAAATTENSFSFQLGGSMYLMSVQHQQPLVVAAGAHKN